MSDNGPGIATQHLPRIFDHFYQVRQGDTSIDKGIGLGLAFVAWIVKAHGGQVGVVSQEGMGATFTVRLPVGQAGAAPAAENRREHSPAQSTD